MPTSQDKPLVEGELVLCRRVQFAETDMAGVMHFANYYRVMEEAEHAFWRSLGLSVITEADGVEVSWPRVATSCEYFSPLHFEEELQAALKVTHVGDRSVSYEVEFRSGGRRIARGRMTAVCCTTRDGQFQPVSIPPSLRTLLKEREGMNPEGAQTERL